MNVKKVLLVEDHPGMQISLAECVRVVFGKEVVVLVAGTLLEAEDFFKGHADELDFILMDTSLGKGITTYDLTSNISKVFKRPIIATTTDDSSQKHMMRIGCTHKCYKWELLEFLRGLKN